jgi:protein required for attachment to host cells
MDTTWIVTANASRVRIFAEEPNAERLEEVKDLVDDRVRMRTIETHTDQPVDPKAASQSINNTGGALPGSTYQPAKTPVQHETEIFAREVCMELQQAYNQQRFRNLVLMASPEFLGVLRKQLSPQLQSAIVLELNKDYTQLPPQELRAQVHAQRQQH